MSASISSIFIPTIALAVAVGVIFFSHPVHNLLSLIFVFFISCGLLILVGAEFAAFLFLIVYVGAIMILFLFVIMLLNLNKIISLEQAVLPDSAFLITSTSLIILFSFEAAISSAIHTFFVSTEIVSTLDISSANSLKWFVNNRFQDILTFSAYLYTRDVYLFYLTTLLLLTSMLGSITLAMSAVEKADWVAVIELRNENEYNNNN